MKTNRREFLKVAGLAGTVAVAGRWGTASAAEGAAPRKGERGMAKGLTLLHRRHDGHSRLCVKTDKGILDAAEAARLLKMPCPATIDDLLQGEQGPALNAIVKKALTTQGLKNAFLKEDGVQYGPVVTRPEKIVCVGLNYRKHAAEVGAPVPKQPVLFNKYNNALNHHGGTVRLPTHAATKFDYEVELVMVMGKAEEAPT